MFAIFKKKKPLESPEAKLILQPSMPRANTKMIRFWHFHTDPARAGPTRVQKYLSKRTPRFLRTTVPPPPPPYSISNQWKATKPELATMTLGTVNELETFLATHYKTKSGFKYKKGELDILSLSEKHSTIVLLRNPEGHICGCVMSTDFKGLFRFQDESTQPPCIRMIQYLCIHPLLRSRGLGGWLLGWLDTFTHEAYGPSIHMGWWVSSKRFCNTLPSIAQVKFYKYVLDPKPLRTYEEEIIVEIKSESARRILDELITEPAKEWLGSTNGSYIGLASIPSNQEIHWWRYTTDDLHGCSVLVGLAPTQLMATEGQVWQVVYCSYVRARPGNVHDISMPFWEDSHTYKYIPRKAIEFALNAQGVRVAIVSDIHSQYGGGSHPSKWSSEAKNGWIPIQERSKLCIYNWMPPSFQFEDILWVAPTL